MLRGSSKLGMEDLETDAPTWKLEEGMFVANLILKFINAYIYF